MKDELSSMDLHFLSREFQVLDGAKIEKIYQKDKDFLFRLHVPSKGRLMLRMLLPGKVFLTEYKEDYPDRPPGYCMFLRKYLTGARIKEIRQHGFERILEFTILSKRQGETTMFYLIAELFSKGNLILCNDDMKIRSPLENQNWADRTIRGGIKYKYPPERADTLNISQELFSEMLLASKKHSLVKTLAIDFGLGGLYAEELCVRAGEDKEIKPSQSNPKNIYKTFQKMSE